MKKLITIISTVLLLVLMANNVNARPIYIGGIKIYWARWSVTTGNCQDGKGLCFRIETGTNGPQNFFGYDPETGKASIRIGKKDPEAHHFSQAEFLLEDDSPVDPKITGRLSELRTNGKIVVLKKGDYKVSDDGDYYTVSIDYYLQ